MSRVRKLEIEFYQNDLGYYVYITTDNKNKRQLKLEEFFNEYEEASLIIYTKIKNEYSEFVKEREFLSGREHRNKVIVDFIEAYFPRLDNVLDVIIMKPHCCKFNLEIPYIKNRENQKNKTDTYVLK